jgi:CheY-like chemotaxis protein
MGQVDMNKSILLVDDVRMHIEIEKDFLKFNTLDILTAKDGLEALNIVKTRRPDLVFMDMQMQYMDGATACRAIKDDASLVNTPVVLITAMGNDESRKACYSAGCDYLLTKPLDRDVFLNVARMFMPSIDRRVKRVSAKIDCSLRCQDKMVAGHLSNLGSSGAFVVTDYSPVPGSIVQISFSLPEGALIVCPGMIVWDNRMESKIPKGFGIKFSLIAKEAKTNLDRFLESVHTDDAER